MTDPNRPPDSPGSPGSASERIYVAARAEFRQWLRAVPPENSPGTPVSPTGSPSGPPAAARRVCPRPDQPGGLPTGWHNVSSHIEAHNQARVLWFLARRDTGGWVLLAHKEDAASTAVVTAEARLSMLYTEFAATLADSGTAPMRLVGEVTGWLQSLLGALYDPTDRHEAAEKVLFGLTGRVRTPPRADI